MGYKAPLLVVSIVFVLVGLFGLVYQQRFTPVSAAPVLTAEAQASKFAFPVSMALPAINVDLPIIPNHIRNGKWGEVPNGISYLLQSPVPGRSGNSVFYGHNWPNLLGRLKESKANDSLIVRYTDGSEKEFVIRQVNKVLASDIRILENTADTRITLYTCIGLFDSHRLVVIAVPKELSKI